MESIDCTIANVFEVCNRQGSDLKRIVSDTREIINDKIEVEMEIETMIAGSKNELNIMVSYTPSYFRINTIQTATNTVARTNIKILPVSITRPSYKLISIILRPIIYASTNILNDKLEEKREELLADMPQMLSKLTLLVNSGMVVREAWKKVADGGERELYKEMQLTFTYS